MREHMPRPRSGFSPAPPVVQRKLTVGKAGDAHEREADQMAEQVMRSPLPNAASFLGRPGPLEVQRACASCEAGDKDDEEVQRQPAGASAPVSVGGASANIAQMRAGAGQPLPAPTLAFMQERFGHDFSRVRVHTGALAERTAAQLSARAFTVGSDLVFGSGQFAPDQSLGRKLIAHELTHVIQQGAARRGRR